MPCPEMNIDVKHYVCMVSFDMKYQNVFGDFTYNTCYVNSNIVIMTRLYPYLKYIVLEVLTNRRSARYPSPYRGVSEIQ